MGYVLVFVFSLITHLGIGDDYLLHRDKLWSDWGGLGSDLGLGGGGLGGDCARCGRNTRHIREDIYLKQKQEEEAQKQREEAERREAARKEAE
eukprot:CAMPEP_0174315496 /NCGR_PEP_ID=MMETSP0810-20121108/6325_1 /TAXON_ID=73025 ORGANISM="Eutreptiella gymnastica-like, Strain CCMP1594" /NCGR_SAMPLE_ID=MMETSP0810 /ASSEMBLY_ACC=CAM_ASM_000659 /LENGTH=92 /DNA_ID=CAMNT_0015424901 /DNA_START=591 /DNA_END=866 /DNA_ORIENTATION=-